MLLPGWLRRYSKVAAFGLAKTGCHTGGTELFASCGAPEGGCIPPLGAENKTPLRSGGRWRARMGRRPCCFGRRRPCRLHGQAGRPGAVVRGLGRGKT